MAGTMFMRVEEVAEEGRYHGNAQGRKSDALGTAYERNTGKGNGNRQ